MPKVFRKAHHAGSWYERSGNGLLANVAFNLPNVATVLRFQVGESYTVMDRPSGIERKRDTCPSHHRTVFCALLPSLFVDLCLPATLDTPTVVMSWPMPTAELTNRECTPQVLCRIGASCALFFRNRVFLLGPSHHYYTDRCVLSSAETYRTPLGTETVTPVIHMRHICP